MIVATFALVIVAALASFAALGISVAVARQSATITAILRRHRLGHEEREGRKDPAANEERRRLNLGAPRGVGERRTGTGRLLGPEEKPPADVHPTTAQMPRLPRPGEIGRR